jgi:hypothetical protein
VAGSWKENYSKELHNLYVSPNIIRVIELRRMIWTDTRRIREMSLIGNVKG